MKQKYSTPNCRILHIDSNELLATSEKMGKGEGPAPTMMESNQRDNTIWDE